MRLLPFLVVVTTSCSVKDGAVGVKRLEFRSRPTAARDERSCRRRTSGHPNFFLGPAILALSYASEHLLRTVAANHSHPSLPAPPCSRPNPLART